MIDVGLLDLLFFDGVVDVVVVNFVLNYVDLLCRLVVELWCVSCGVVVVMIWMFLFFWCWVDVVECVGVVLFVGVKFLVDEDFEWIFDGFVWMLWDVGLECLVVIECCWIWNVDLNRFWRLVEGGVVGVGVFYIVFVFDECWWFCVVFEVVVDECGVDGFLFLEYCVVVVVNLLF